MPEVTTVDPSTGQVLATYPGSDVDGVLSVLTAVHAAQPDWAARPVEERAELVRAVGAQLRTQAADLAALMTAEMGKPIAEARAEVEKSATACDYYAEHGPGFLADRPVDTGSERRSWVGHEPIGVVLAVMPWNFPFWQVLRFAAPTLLAGNTAILKHSPNVTGCALAIEQVFRDAGLPSDVFRSVVVAEADVPEVSRALIEDDRIAAVSLTGSERAGAAVAAAAGGVIKKSLLELGGSDPFVVLADADLDVAVAGAVKSRFINSGQSCLAAKRFVVHAAVAGEFSRRFAAAVADLRVGDPRDEETDIGPMAVASSRGSPTRSPATASANRRVNSDATEEWTTNRLAARQLWPPLRNRERTAEATATSRSASPSTTNGSDPPSSSTLFFTAAPAAAATADPARSLPVSVTAATRGSSISVTVTAGTSGSATTRARSTPAGTPAARNTPSMARAHPVTLGECLSRPVLPASRAGAAKRMTCQNGKFHGITARTTPSGSYATQLRLASVATA